MKTFAWLCGVLIAVVVAGAICWRSWGPSALPLRLALDPWPSEELLWIAKERGFFADEGLDVHLVEFNSASSSHTAFERGQVDLMVATSAEVVSKNSRQLRVVLALDWSAGADVVLTRPDIADVAALKGRRVAFEPGTLTSHHLLRALESAGLSWQDVTPVPIPVASMNEAFAMGEVDAIVTYPPFSGELVSTGQAHAVFDSSRIPQEIVDMLVSDTAVLERIPDLPARLRRVWGRALTLLTDEDALTAMGRREHLTGAQFRAVLSDGIELVKPEQQIDLIAEDGALSKSFPRVQEAMRLAGEPVTDVPVKECLLPRAAFESR